MSFIKKLITALVLPWKTKTWEEIDDVCLRLQGKLSDERSENAEQQALKRGRSKER